MQNFDTLIIKLLFQSVTDSTSFRTSANIYRPLSVAGTRSNELHFSKGDKRYERNIQCGTRLGTNRGHTSENRKFSIHYVLLIVEIVFYYGNSNVAVFFLVRNLRGECVLSVVDLEFFTSHHLCVIEFCQVCQELWYQPTHHDMVQLQDIGHNSESNISGVMPPFI